MHQTYALAIVGLPGSGKTEVVRHLEKIFRLPNVYFGAIVLDEVARRGLALTQENERPIRNEFRKEHGLGAMAILSLPKIEEHLRVSDVLLESLYSWEEYLFLKEKLGDRFKVIAVHSSPAVRYGRLTHRPIRPLTHDEAVGRDISQIEELHQAGPIAMADYMVLNTDEITALQAEVEKAYQFLTHKH